MAFKVMCYFILQFNLKAGSHDPIFGSDFYSNSKKLLTRINMSMS